MKKIASLFLLLLLVLFACKKKEENYTIAGTIVNPEINAPVASAKISLWGTKISSGVVQNQQEKIGETYSALNGSFEFRFDKQVYSTLKLIVQHHSHFNAEKTINPNDLSPNKPYSIQVNLHAVSWLKTTIKNVGAQNHQDKLVYRLGLPYDDCTDCCSEQQRIFTGIGVDTTWTCPVYGGKHVSILWIYSNGLTSSPHNDTIFIAIGDTVFHPIFY